MAEASPAISVRLPRPDKGDLAAAKALLEETFAFHAQVAAHEAGLQFRPAAQAAYLEECLWIVQETAKGRTVNERVWLAFQTEPSKFGFKTTEKPVGLLLARILRDYYYSIEYYGYIEQLIITETARKSGVGPQLLDAAYQWLRSRDIKAASLKVYGPNLDALRFYEREGFQSLRHELIKHL